MSPRHRHNGLGDRRDGIPACNVEEGDELVLFLRQLIDNAGPPKTRLLERHGGPRLLLCTWVSAIVVLPPMSAGAGVAGHGFGSGTEQA